MWEEDAPEPEPEPEKPRRRKGRKRVKREKPDREEIFAALEKMGYEPTYHVLDGRNQSLSSLPRLESDLIFNLTESYAGDDTMDMNIAAYLDLVGCCYTGAGPQALYLAQDKALAKKIFAFHGIRTPFFATSYRGKLDHSHDIAFPLIVKPVSEDGSIGIDASSVVGSVKELMEKIHDIHEEFDSSGPHRGVHRGPRDLRRGARKRETRKRSRWWSSTFPSFPKALPRSPGKRSSGRKRLEAYKVTKSAPAEGLDEETTQKLSDTAISAYQALKLRDYGRIDMRLTEKGEVYVIEANPNPWLSSGAEFAMSARKAGRSYTQLVAEIVDLARARYAPT